MNLALAQTGRELVYTNKKLIRVVHVSYLLHFLNLRWPPSKAGMLASKYFTRVLEGVWINWNCYTAQQDSLFFNCFPLLFLFISRFIIRGATNEIKIVVETNE